MPITEADRHRLYESLKTTLGQSEAETFMNLMPPGDWNDLSTKADLEQLRHATKADLDQHRLATKADIDQLRLATKADLDQLRLATKSDTDQLRTEFRGEFAELRAEFRGEFAELRADLTKTFGTWLFASQAGVIAAVAVIVAFLG